MARILIAGCGDVGGAAGRLLAADGHEVFGLRRDVSRLPAELAPVAADLGDAEGLARALPPRVEVLLYTAAAAGFDDDAYRLAYVAGLRNVLAATGRERLARVVFVSSTGVYGRDDGAWVDEHSPPEPAGFSARRLLEGEALAAASGITAVSVRFGGIYGPGRTRLVGRVREGGGCTASPVQWTNRIHRDDCAGVLRHLAILDEVQELYLGVDCEPAPQCAVMDWIAARLGLPPPPRTGGERRRRGGSKRCSNARLLASGYRFLYPTYREGYARVLAGERA